jgi:hypothetical protein
VADAKEAKKGGVGSPGPAFFFVRCTESSYGFDSWEWWALSESSRTAALIPFEVDLVE